MKPKKVIITQSNYIPWKGYFDALRLVDEVVLYDDVQYTKRDWRNRNKIKTSQGLQWLSIPVKVKGKFFQAIRDTKVTDKRWKEKHWRTLQINYAKAPFMKHYQAALENLYLSCEEEYLSLINHWFLQGVNQILGIDTPMRFSSEFSLVAGKTERLLDLCKQVGGTDYYTGNAAKNYLNEDLFEQENIRVHYLDYKDYLVYPQLYPPFIHEVSILDLILNTGDKANIYLKNFENP